MNREIKFRGKSIMNNTYGDWLHSSGIKYGDDVELMYCDEETSEEWNYIDKETLGQYTGLHDKNGKEIYEGDIVKITNKNSKVIPIKPLIAQIVWSEEYLAYILITTSVKDAFKNLGDYIDYDIEVIGNVWEDSDLLNDSENTKSN